MNVIRSLMVLDEIERGIIRAFVEESGGVDLEAKVAKADRWALAISFHVEQGEDVLHSVIAIRELVLDSLVEVERGRGRPTIPRQLVAIFKNHVLWVRTISKYAI